MSDISDEEIQPIVQRLVAQLAGLSTQNSTPQNISETVKPSPQAEPKASTRKVVAMGADHGGYELKEILKKDVADLGYEVVDVGTHSKEAVDYPDFAHEVARAVSEGSAWRGIMIDGAGIGSCIVANKVPGVRAGLAYDYASAVNGREHNDTNVLTLGAGLIGVNLAKQIVRVWLSTAFGGGRHERRLIKIVAIEKLYLQWIHLVGRD